MGNSIQICLFCYTISFVSSPLHFCAKVALLELILHKGASAVCATATFIQRSFVTTRGQALCKFRWCVSLCVCVGGVTLYHLQC